jgi:FixJ family two-component response regulator
MDPGTPRHGNGSIIQAVPSVRETLPEGGRVFLVDDDAAVRRALTRLLRAGGLDVESFPSADALLAALEIHEPACVVADLRMPGLSGLDLQDELARRGVDLPLLFISGRADVTSSVRAMKGGAVDFLEKPVSDTDLLHAIARALARNREQQAARRERATLQARLARLTPREREVFALVASGLLNKQAGHQLGTTEKTIKVHRARVMEKMEARSLADLVRMAERLGITGPPPPQ